MRVSQLGVVAALGAVGQAFLMPPTITPADNEIVKALPFEAELPADGRGIVVKCPGCPVDITNLEGQTKAAASRGDSVLLFNFSISHGDQDQLMLNDFPLYPLDTTPQRLDHPLTADQLVETSDGHWNYAASPKLGYSVGVQPLAFLDNEQIGLTTLRLQVMQLGQAFIIGFPTVEIKLLETPSGKLLIGDIDIINGPENISDDQGEECTTIICRWRAIVADKILKLKGLKGCGGRRRPHQGSTMEPAKPIHHGHPRPAHGTHRPHHHHHRHGGFALVLRAIVFHVFIPIMVGVVVGIMASIVGMVVGHIAIFIWRMLFRRGQRATYHRVQLEKTSAHNDEDEDSKSLLGHDNPPPVYEEAPAYADAVVDEKA